MREPRHPLTQVFHDAALERAYHARAVAAMALEMRDLIATRRFAARGPITITIKGKGELPTWLLTSRRA